MSQLEVRPVDGGVVVFSQKPVNVAVYDAAGRCVAKALVRDEYRFELPQGVYVVGEKMIFLR